MEVGILNRLRKFADDTKLLARTGLEEDGRRLQEDLRRLNEWAEFWKMPFNLSKCKVMHLGRGNEKRRLKMGEW